MDFKPFKIGKHTIKKPIVQGGMGIGISWDQLAGTVSKEGGLGVISSVGTGYYNFPLYSNGKDIADSKHFDSKEALMEIFANARKICGNDVPLATNIMRALSSYRRSVKDACEAGTDIIICGAGVSLDLPKLTAEYPDVAVVPIVSSIKATETIYKKWTRDGRVPDAIIVEGPLSGGHQGFKTKEDCELPENQLEVIIKPIIEFCKIHNIPVIAAGGIWDKKDIEKYIKMGCSAVQMGTRFIATYECDTSQAHKDILINCQKSDISFKGSPVGLPSRSITTNLHRMIEEGNAPEIICKSNCVAPCKQGEGARKVGYCIADRLADCSKGNAETGLFFTGSNGYRVDKIISVKELLDELTT